MMKDVMAVKMNSESQNGLRVIGNVGSHLDRRQFLGWGSAALLHKATQAVGRHPHIGSETSEFRTPLPIPSILDPVRTDATTDYYEVVQREAWVEIIPGAPTRIWGYNGSFPGPTIRARRGRTTVVTHTNNLSAPSVVHLHGGVTRPEFDGFPTDAIAPGRRAATNTLTPGGPRHSGTTIITISAPVETSIWASRDSIYWKTAPR
jgi:FtsP/CotA-like multicopper oxidase with cupredoxin domain